jgi:hypothetical protein
MGADGQEGHRRPSAFRRIAPAREGAVVAPVSVARAPLPVTVCVALCDPSDGATTGVEGAASALVPPLAALHATSAASGAIAGAAAGVTGDDAAGALAAPPPPPRCHELARAVAAVAPSAAPGSGSSSAFSRVRKCHRAGALGPLARDTAAGENCAGEVPRDASLDDAAATAPGAPLCDAPAASMTLAGHDEMTPAPAAAEAAVRSAPVPSVAASVAAADVAAGRPETSHGRRGLSRTCGATTPARAGNGLGATSAAEAASQCAELGSRQDSGGGALRRAPRRGDADGDIRCSGVAGTRSGATAAAARHRAATGSVVAAARVHVEAGTAAVAAKVEPAALGRIKMAPLSPHAAMPAPTEYVPRLRPQLTALPAQDARCAYT